jgi:hypothetical protein
VGRPARTPDSCLRRSLVPYTRGVSIGPAPIISLFVGGFHAALFTFVLGRADARTILVYLAAVLGAWAGDATDGRLGLDPVRIGDFHLLAASVVAWAGMIFVAVLSILGPGPRQEEP